LAARPYPLHIEVGQDAPGTVVIRCAGDLDLSSVRELAEAIDWSYTADLRTLRVDLSAVTFIDSSGIRCLIEAQGGCKQLGTTFEIVPSDAVHRILQFVDVEFLTP
jgi:anti-sigma B factor antagonist